MNDYEQARLFYLNSDYEFSDKYIKSVHMFYKTYGWEVYWRN